MEIDIKKPAFDIKIRCNDEMLRQMQKHYGENLENLSTDNLINFLDKSTKTGQTSLRYFDVRDEQYLTQIHKFYNGNDWNGKISKFDVKEFINNTPILTLNEKQNEIDNMQDYRLRNKIMQLEGQANILKELYEKLTEEEKEIVRRTRNTKNHHLPKNAELEDYMYASAFEGLIGYLYLTKQDERLNEIL